MSTDSANTSDPLDIFAETPVNAEPTTDNSASHVSNNPFDPLGGSQSSLSNNNDKVATSSKDPLDLLSQISSWGAQNKDASAADEKEKQTEEETPVSPTMQKANVMATKENALELSDDLVAEAHKEFEATEDQLRKFEQEQQQPSS
jgi:hypothetical protein